MLLNLVKQSASISATGAIVLGPAVDGGFAINFSSDSNLRGAAQTIVLNDPEEPSGYVPYVLTDEDQHYEIGIAKFYETGISATPRQILESNLEGGGFPASTPGLVFSVSAVAHHSIACSGVPANQNNNGSHNMRVAMPPLVYGVNSIAIGPGARADGFSSVSVGGHSDGRRTVNIGGSVTDGSYDHVVIGSGAKSDGYGKFGKTIIGAGGYAYHAGETSVGHQSLPKKSSIPVVTTIGPLGSGSLGDASGEVIDLMWQSGPGDLRGDCRRLTGRLLIRPTAFSANDQARVVSITPAIFIQADTDVNASAPMAIVLTPTFVDEYVGANAPAVTLTFTHVTDETAVIDATSGSGAEVLITGVLEVEYLGYTPGVDSQPAAPLIASLPVGLQPPP